MKLNSNKNQPVTIAVTALLVVSAVMITTTNMANGDTLTKDQRYSLGAIDACDAISFGIVSASNLPTNSTIGNHHSQSYLDGFKAGFGICSKEFNKGYTSIESSSFRHPIFQTDEGSGFFVNQLNPTSIIQLPDAMIKNNYTVTH